MKKLHAIFKNTAGLTLIEVLLSVLIIVSSAIAVLMWQKTSWSQTSYTNRLMVAGHVIEKQMEQRRMLIAQNAAANFAAFKTAFVNKDTTIVDSSLTPPIKVRWCVKDTLRDPSNVLLTNVVWVRLKANWGTGKTDTLTVYTCISKDF